MSNEAGPAIDPADVELAGGWLQRHGLTDVRPSPLLATRLAARRRARRGGSVLLAALLIGAALTQAYDRLATAASDGSPPHRWTPLLVLTTLVVGLLVVQARLDSWVRRIDRRAGAALSTRATHTVQPGWRAILGWPHATFAVATFAGAMVLAVTSLTVPDVTVRYAAVVLLIGLVGVGGGIVVHLRHLLVGPVVAEDEASLAADVIMRVEDARELVAPTALWSLPVILLFSTEFGWWNAASLVLVLLGGVALHQINARTPTSATVARQVMSAR